MKVFCEKLNIRDLDKMIIPIGLSNNEVACYNPKPSLARAVLEFGRKLSLSHRYAQQAGYLGCTLVCWKTKYELKTGNKIILSQDEMFQLYNYTTTAISKFGRLLRQLVKNDRDTQLVLRFTDKANGSSSVSSPNRDVCIPCKGGFQRTNRTVCCKSRTKGCQKCKCQQCCGKSVCKTGKCN